MTYPQLPPVYPADPNFVYPQPGQQQQPQYQVPGLQHPPQPQPQPVPQPPVPQPVPQPFPQPPAPQPQPVPQVPQFVLPPAPQPPPQQQQPPAPAAPQTPPASGGSNPPNPAPGTGNEPAGFPANTPWRDMRPDEQLAYWQHQARRHEERWKGMSDYEQLKATAQQYQQVIESSQTEHERALAEARRQGHASALEQAGAQLVDQWIRAAAINRLPDESVNALLSHLDRKAFLDAQGGVDTAKVYAYVGTIAPAPQQPPAVPPVTPPGQQPPAVAPGPVPPPQQVLPYAPPGGPDFGQGNPGSAEPSGLAAGAAIAAKRFGAPA